MNALRTTATCLFIALLTVVGPAAAQETAPEPPAAEAAPPAAEAAEAAPVADAAPALKNW